MPERVVPGADLPASFPTQVGPNPNPSTASDETTASDEATASEDQIEDASNEESSVDGMGLSPPKMTQPRAVPPRSPTTQSRLSLTPTLEVTLDFVNKPVMELIKWMAEITGRNFILRTTSKAR